MTSRITQSAVILAALTASVHAGAREHLQCSIELQAAESIIGFREQGRPKSFLTDLLPPRTPKPGEKPRPRHPTITSQMYSIIDEVYAHPTLGLQTYLEYRNQSCINRTARIKVPKTLADVALPLADCQARFGAKQSQGLAQCVKAIFEKYNKNDF